MNKEITLLWGEKTTVSGVDYELLNQLKWNLSANGYAVTGHNNIKMHDLIVTEYNKSTHEVHHKDENKLNNIRENLIVLTFSKHLITRSKQSNNTSGYKGVYLKIGSGNRANAWVAQIGYGRQRVYIGRYLTAEDAARAYDNMAVKLYGDSAKLNFTYARPV